MSTAPMPPGNHPHQNAGWPGGSFPPPPPRPPRRQGWFGRQSEAVRITIIGAVIAGVFSLAGAVLTSALTDKGGSASDAKAPTQSPTATEPGTPPPSSSEVPSSEPSTASDQESDGPSPDSSSTAPTTAPEAGSYTEVYPKQAMSLGLPPGSDLGTIDFDAPATRRYTGEEWDRAKEKAEQSGVPIEADLTYQDTLEGYLSLRNGRNAAQLQPTDASEQAQDCARAARVGGFTESVMSKWDLPAKTVLCVLTDKGNVARVVITGFIGGNPRSSIAPPAQIALEVTLWKLGA
ncbi:hypothetical protein PV371_08260 [Streptomyces sp. TX20-6-3]|uniref:hypothetical protein n=1 Tax=Streptomyces sp. TX20-6-3 TaxID=3028705 RepID=UPI0029A50C19|nr:hypothetical protein [Streptomyces sp. TX20-6-3]MDX2559639.1 hypothetical protein [Streptomyces sp. TX20-6-3]